MTEKEQKDQLEAYAREKFGVDLDKRKKLETLQELVRQLDKRADELKADIDYTGVSGEHVSYGKAKVMEMASGMSDRMASVAQQIEDCEALTSRPPTVSEEVNKRIDELSTVFVVDDAHSGIQAIGVDENDGMNALALRIWQGQSVSLSLKVRVQRIASALREKGFNDLSGLVLPTNENIARFM